MRIYSYIGGSPNTLSRIGQSTATVAVSGRFVGSGFSREVGLEEVEGICR